MSLTEPIPDAIAADPLLPLIERFLAATHMEASVFGKLALNNAAYVYKLRHGGQSRLSTRAKVVQFMRNYGKAVSKTIP